MSAGTLSKQILLFIIVFSSLYGCNKNNDNIEKDSANKLIQKKLLSIEPGSGHIKWTILRNNGYLTGTMKFSKGTIIIDDNGLPATADISVDAESITVDNINDAELNKKAVELIRSEKYLNTQTYRTIDFYVRSFLPLRYAGKPDKNATVKGNIKVKDKEVPVALAVTVKYLPDAIECQSIQQFQASDWNIDLPALKPDPSYNNNPLRHEFEIDFFFTAK